MFNPCPAAGDKFGRLSLSRSTYVGLSELQGVTQEVTYRGIYTWKMSLFFVVMSSNFATNEPTLHKILHMWSTCKLMLTTENGTRIKITPSTTNHVKNFRFHVLKYNEKKIWWIINVQFKMALKAFFVIFTKIEYAISDRRVSLSIMKFKNKNKKKRRQKFPILDATVSLHFNIITFSIRKKTFFLKN